MQPHSVLRRFWKPAVATGASSTALAIWFEEILLYAEEILALIFLPLMAAAIYLVNILIFKAHLPIRPNNRHLKDKGEKK